jgi:hypothetical protein
MLGLAWHVCASATEMVQHTRRASLLNPHRRSGRSKTGTRADRVKTLLMDGETKYIAYEYNGGRLNNQLHSISFAFRLCREVLSFLAWVQ